MKTRGKRKLDEAPEKIDLTSELPDLVFSKFPHIVFTLSPYV